MSKIVVFRVFYIEDGDNSTVFGNVIGKSRGGVDRQRCSNHETEVGFLYNLVDFP